jgi:hypothetical protein
MAVKNGFVWHRIEEVRGSHEDGSEPLASIKAGLFLQKLKTLPLSRMTHRAV